MKSQIWIAVAVYVLVAIVKKRLNLDTSLYTNAFFRQTRRSWIATASVAPPREPERRPIAVRRRRP